MHTVSKHFQVSWTSARQAAVVQIQPQLRAVLAMPGMHDA